MTIVAPWDAPASLTAKKEGDGATPAGEFPLRYVWYRGDRIPAPETALPKRALDRTDGWCNAPEDPRYNQHVPLPCAASTEALWRDDNLYDIIVVLGFNDEPVIKGAGSAIFMHVARADYSPTAGCVALALEDLQEILRTVQPGEAVKILN